MQIPQDRGDHEREQTQQDRGDRHPTKISSTETRRPPSLRDQADNNDGVLDAAFEPEAPNHDDDDAEDEGAKLWFQFFSVADGHARNSTYRQS